MPDIVSGSKSYQELLSRLKNQIHTARVSAALAVNQELVLLYGEIGTEILVRQQQEGWGAKIIVQLGRDLRHAFPDMQRFSPRNLKYMRAFVEAWPGKAIVQQAAARLPWFHNCVLLDKVNDTAERSWYIQQTIQNGWSRNVLVLQIESDLYRR